MTLIQSKQKEQPLFVDARHLRTGIGAYTYNLLKRLYEDYRWPLHCLTRPEESARLRKFSQSILESSAPIYSLREQYAVARAAQGEKLLHIPHYNVPLAARGTMVVTVHDLTHILFEPYERGLKSKIYARPMLLAACKRANHIVTVSEYSKRMMVERLGVAPEKVSVIYNGVDERFSPGAPETAKGYVQKRFGMARPYLLSVGSFKPHKNIELLLRSYSELDSGMRKVLQVVIVGQGADGRSQLEKLAEKLQIAPLFIEDASFKDLLELYRAAEGVVVPSLEEGFGLPVLEGMACGVPVLCSSAASLPEVYGEAALPFDPRNQEELTVRIQELVSSATLRNLLVARGLAQVKRFSWADSASRHVAIYESLLRNEPVPIGLSSQADSKVA